MSNEILKQPGTRRAFLQQSTTASLALGALALARGVHAAGTDETIRVGVVGCGGRGAGAARDALHADPGAKLVAIGDVFADQAGNFLENVRLDEAIADRIDVPTERVFAGFDAYRKVIDSGVDVVLLTAPPHFRPEHFAYAVAQGKHTFVEKPIAVDAPGVRAVQQVCEEARQKRLSVVSGLCWRYELGMRATVEKIKEGAIGDIVAIESLYNAGTLWHRGDKPDWSRMEYQLRNWLYYTWISGDHIVEQAVHSLDKTAWLLGDVHPLKAWGVGGRQQRTDPKFGNIYDHHTVFYEYPGGVRVYFSCRQQAGTSQVVEETVHGSKGRARLVAHEITAAEQWRYRGPKPSMYRVEHEALFRSIRDSAPVDDGHYMCNSTMIGIMGRMCTYTGQELTWEQAYESQQRLGPTAYDWSDVPEQAVAMPGVTKLA
ncbi:MAG: Gfo/Idh/MocA family oxidoreductase [Pirellulales bacterium]|nr:Gfo/Idh/MocA family oxidoreductase [Pirellulales bacterium]